MKKDLSEEKRKKQQLLLLLSLLEGARLEAIRKQALIDLQRAAKRQDGAAQIQAARTFMNTFGELYDKAKEDIHGNWKRRSSLSL